MRKKLFLLLSIGIVANALSQKDSQTLLTIDGAKVSVKDFKEVYEKNFNLVEGSGEIDFDKNLDLFINYKLKIKQAYSIKLDTLKSYKAEIETYKSQLYAPYLNDQKILDSITKETYERSKFEIKASHILVRLKENSNPQDTLIAYNKIIEARNKILNGANFETIAKQYSEDRSVVNNAGDLGYFSTFKMVKEFEDAAYRTNPNSISMPFKTRFGYHILKVFDKRVSKGERKVSHILITGDFDKGKKTIDSIFALLQKGQSFEEIAKKISNDITSKPKGGELPRFGSGRMIPDFEKVAFFLNNKNEISKPFKTRFGWHIIKLLEVYPVLSFEESKNDLENNLKRSGRYSISRKAMIDKLKRKYNIKENKAAKNIFSNKNLLGLPKDSLQEVLFYIDEKPFYQEDFVAYLKNRRHKSIEEIYEVYQDEKVLNHYKNKLVDEDPEFAKTLKEYEDGLLLFELMQRKVWKKSTDSLSLATYYEKNKANFNKPLDSIKGDVINAYQKEIDQEWVASLRKSSAISIRKKIVNKLKKYYAKKSN